MKTIGHNPAPEEDIYQPNPVSVGETSEVFVQDRSPRPSALGPDTSEGVEDVTLGGYSPRATYDNVISDAADSSTVAGGKVEMNSIGA